MWWPVSEVVRVYAVTESKLTAFWKRGDLNRQRMDGELCYPVELVHELFPRRGSAALDDREGSVMATVGLTKLGDASPEAAEVKILSRPPQPALPADREELRFAIAR